MIEILTVAHEVTKKEALRGVADGDTASKPDKQVRTTAQKGDPSRRQDKREDK